MGPVSRTPYQLPARHCASKQIPIFAWIVCTSTEICVTTGLSSAIGGLGSEEKDASCGLHQWNLGQDCIGEKAAGSDCEQHDWALTRVVLLDEFVQFFYGKQQ